VLPTAAWRRPDRTFNRGGSLWWRALAQLKKVAVERYRSLGKTWRRACGQPSGTGTASPRPPPWSATSTATWAHLAPDPCLRLHLRRTRVRVCLHSKHRRRGGERPCRHTAEGIRSVMGGRRGFRMYCCCWATGSPRLSLWWSSTGCCAYADGRPSTPRGSWSAVATRWPRWHSLFSPTSLRSRSWTPALKGPIAEALRGADIAYFANFLVAGMLYGGYRLLRIHHW